MNWDEYANFSREEFECHCCGEALMDWKFLDKLQSMRDYLGVPMIITSGYRCPQYNRSIGGSDRHPSGKAADFQMAPHRYQVAFLYAMQHFRGKGLLAHGPHWGRFIHVDDYKEGMWTYES